MYKRIIISIILSILIVLASLGVASYLTVRDTISRAMDKRIELARTIAHHTDTILESNFNRLYDISLAGNVDFNDRSWIPEQRALETAYQYSLFTDGIFLTDRSGKVVLSHPARLDSPAPVLDEALLREIMQHGKPVISGMRTVARSQRKVLFALVPLKNRHGEVIGVAGGEINPTTYLLHQIISSAPAEANVFVELVDADGVVIASNAPERLFTGSDHDRFLASLIATKTTAVRRCHRCHETDRDEGGTRRTDDILAFAPLESAAWGVSILQPEREVFAPANELKRIFLFASIGSIGIALVIAVGMSRSIVKPVHELIDATRKIAAGDMSKSIGFGGVDEIGMLSSSFEVMRVRLADLMEELHQYNVELEQKVETRTQEIRTSQRKVQRLLQTVISAQEEERKRMAREIHDDTMQSLSALLLRFETLRRTPGDSTDEKTITDMKEIIVKTLGSLRTIIQNLRPSILDDLGLESAIRWLLDKHLGERDIHYSFDIIGEHRRFHPSVETTIFRIVQEAITNIVRHAAAENVFVTMLVEPKRVVLDVEDDGPGFDVGSALVQTEDGRGLGLLGMKERASLLDGDLRIHSAAGKGTRITLIIPLETQGDEHAKDTVADRR